MPAASHGHEILGANTFAALIASLREILSEAMKMLKPGGEIVYSTCTYSPEEDEEIVAWLVENYLLEIEPLKRDSGRSAGIPEVS